MYFKDFPRFVYDFKYADKDIRTEIVTDITRNVRFRKELMKNITQFDEYDVQDGESPEIIAEKLYGNAQYHWILMLLNERYDYASDFPLEETALIRHIEDSYPDDVFNKNSATIIADIVLRMGMRYADNTFSTEELALKNYLAQGTTSATKYAGSYADITGNGTVNAADSRLWLLSAGDAPDSLRRTTPLGGKTITVQEILDEIVATENATPGTYPSGLFLSSAYYGIHHYVDNEGYIVDKSNPQATAVYNDQYERALNEEKRRIKVLAPNMIAIILKNYKELL